MICLSEKHSGFTYSRTLTFAGLQGAQRLHHHPVSYDGDSRRLVETYERPRVSHRRDA